MDANLKAKIRQWKSGMEAGNQFVLEEKRRLTPAERIRMFEAFLADHAQIGISKERPEDRAHKTPYHVIQEQVSARSPRRLPSN
jgi:hypothetical protein